MLSIVAIKHPRARSTVYPCDDIVRTMHINKSIDVKNKNFYDNKLHRTFSFNVFSKRYSEAREEYFYPGVFRKQGEKNHQGSGEDFSAEENLKAMEIYDDTIRTIHEAYDKLVEMGVSREMARFVLPESIYTELYFTVDLRNLLHFLELRLHPHAQKEIREFAKAIYDILNSMEEFKWTLEAFNKFSLNSCHLSSDEIEHLLEFMLDAEDEKSVKITSKLEESQKTFEL